MGAYYRQPDQVEDEDAFSRQLEAASKSRVLKETLSTLPSAGGATQQSTNSLGCSFASIDDNFLSQVVEDPTRNGELLNIILTASPSWSCEVWGSLGCSDHENVDLWRKEEAGQQVRLQLWTSGEPMLAPSGMLEESCGNKPCKGGGV